MKCIHGGDKKSCKTCARFKQPQKVYLYEDSRELVSTPYEEIPTRQQKFCKVHLSIWGSNPWWCLYAIWRDILKDICEEEYLEIRG